MITLKEYEAEDWAKIDDAVEPFMFHESIKEFNQIVKRGVAVTGIEDGNVMACGGIAYVNEDEGIVWVKVSKKCFSQPIRYARGIKEVFKIMMSSMGSMTVTTYILENFCKGEKLAKLIGMKKAGETYEFNNQKYNRYVVEI